MTPEQEKIYEDGFIAGMQKQMQSSVDKAVNRMAQRPWVDLTFDEKQHALYISDWKTTYMEAVIEYIEAKLKEKNNGTTS